MKMKKYKTFIVLFLVFLVLLVVSWIIFFIHINNNGDVEQQSTYESPQKSNYQSILLEGSKKFQDLLEDNPIDEAMHQEEKDLISTLDILNLQNKYYDIWVNELTVLDKKIKEQINSEDEEVFEKSQNAWKEFNLNEPDIANRVLITSMGSGSGDPILIMDQSINRIKQRVFQLAEYYYLLVGDFSFQFSGT